MRVKRLKVINLASQHTLTFLWKAFSNLEANVIIQRVFVLKLDATCLALRIQFFKLTEPHIFEQKHTDAKWLITVVEEILPRAVIFLPKQTSLFDKLILTLKIN